MSKPQTVKLDRYPGLRPFIREDGLIFFGRNMEADMLLQSIKVNMNFILFSKSGLGKSSLINAGVMPKLIEEGFCPIVIRFYNTITDPLPAITSEIIKHLPDGTLTSIPIADRSNLLVLLDHWTKKERVLLIFDQFEEFFYHNISNRDAAITQLAAIANRNFQAERRSPVHLLFLIRSDRLNLMNEVAEKIPGIFSNRYELKPLLKEKAEQAIVLPSQIRDRDNRSAFKYPTFDYSLPAIKIILETLSNKQGEIESSQLQIVCQEMEEIAGLKSARAKTRAPVDIEPEDFKGEAGIREILNKFYSKQLEKLAADKHLGLKRKDIDTIRVIIENELVSGNKRVIQSESRIRELVEKVRPGVTHIANKEKIDAVIDKLLDLRLIREEESHLGKVYEISHDTLLESIIKSRDQRRSNEQKKTIQQQAAQLAEEKRRAADERKLKDKARLERKAAIAAQQAAQEAQLKASKNLRLASISLALAGLLGIIMVVLIIILFKQRNLSNIQKEKYKNVYGQMLVANAARAYENRNHALAFNLAERADSLLGRGHLFLDSLMEKWPQAEYSGNIQTSMNNALIACQYRNGNLQLFTTWHQLRSANTYLIFPGVTSCLLSPDGNFIAISDTTADRINIYSIKSAFSLDTVLVKTIYHNPKLSTMVAINGKYLVLMDPGGNLLVHNYENAEVKRIPDPHAERYQMTFISQDWALSARNDASGTILAIDLKNGYVFNSPVVPILDLSVWPRPYVYDHQKGTVFRVDTYQLTPVFHFRDLPRGMEVTSILLTDRQCALRLYESKRHREQFVIVMRDARKPDSLITISSATPRWDSLGKLVRFTRHELRFVKDGIITSFDSTGGITRHAIGGWNAAITDFANKSTYYQSENADQILFMQQFGQDGLYDILLDPNRPTLSMVTPTARATDKLHRLDLFYTTDGLKKFTSYKKDRVYWRQFYEPLSDFDKKAYGITE